MSTSKKILATIGLFGCSMAANAVPVELTLTDVSSKDTSNPEDIQCIIYGNSCPGGQQVMSAHNYVQGGNQSLFEVTAAPNQSGHKEGSLQNPYTVGYLEQFVGRAFEIGIDVNTAGGKPAERLLEFLVQVNTGSGYVTTHFYNGPTSLDPAFNGNGYFDFTLSLVDLSSFSATDEVRFYARWDQASAGAENFFVWRGSSVSVPEPSTIALMLAGLCLLTLGTQTRRRRRQAIR